MPWCGFPLSLLRFAKDLLRSWDITLAQLTSTSWCVIVKFEIMFHEFQDVLGTDQSTLLAFDHYFTLAIANYDYLSVKHRPNGLRYLT
jgi:hypothetical protein